MGPVGVSKLYRFGAAKSEICKKTLLMHYDEIKEELLKGVCIVEETFAQKGYLEGAFCGQRERIIDNKNLNRPVQHVGRIFLFWRLGHQPSLLAAIVTENSGGNVACSLRILPWHPATFSHCCQSLSGLVGAFFPAGQGRKWKIVPPYSPLKKHPLLFRN